MKLPRGVTIERMRRDGGRLVLDLAVDAKEVAAGLIEDGVIADHDDHEHRVSSIDPPRLGPALRKRT